MREQVFHGSSVRVFLSFILYVHIAKLFLYLYTVVQICISIWIVYDVFYVTHQSFILLKLLCIKVFFMTTIKPIITIYEYEN